jgi:transcriptional regulator with XRE-family HTH domain
VDSEERRLVGARITRARKESGLTQAQLAATLGITTRSVQNYESGAIVPWRHLSHIETITRRRNGWLLRGDPSPGDLESTIGALLAAMEQHHAVLRQHLRTLAQNMESMREQRESMLRRPRPRKLTSG